MAVVVVRMDIGTLTRVNAARETFRDGDVEMRGWGLSRAGEEELGPLRLCMARELDD